MENLQEWNGADFKTWRESLGLTQQEAADAIDVSMPTVAGWEADKTPIDMRTRLACLYLRPPIIFDDESDHFDFWRGGVMFTGETDHGTVTCIISSEAFRDDFGAANFGHAVCLEIFRRKRREFESLVYAKYIKRHHESDGSIIVRSGDVERYRHAP